MFGYKEHKKSPKYLRSQADKACKEGKLLEDQASYYYSKAASLRDLARTIELKNKES